MNICLLHAYLCLGYRSYTCKIAFRVYSIMFIDTNSTSFGYSNIILSELDLLELAGSV